MKIKVLVSLFLLFSLISLANEGINSNKKNTTTLEENSMMSTFSIGDMTIFESDGIVAVPITLDTPDSVDTVLNITTLDGTAISPGDYTAVTTTVTIPAGQTSTQLMIDIIADGISEISIENFTVNATIVSGNTINSSASATITIVDTDDATFSVGDETTEESYGSVSVPISISNPSSVDTVVSIMTVSNTATDFDDYITTTVTATIPAGQVLIYLSIPITDDNIGEPTEDFTVSGMVASGNIANSTDSGTVTIGDDDTPAFTIGDVTVDEYGGTASVPISISNPSSVDTVISITTTDGTANSFDYTTTTVTATIPAGQLSTSVSIPITDDNIYEPTEYFTVSGSVTTGNTLYSYESGTVLITDDASCGSTTVGDPCDDGNPATVSDFIDGNCNCVGALSEDLDGDGISNAQEVLNFSDYNDPCDPIQNVGYTGFDEDNLIWQAANCDNDDLNNALEIILNTDPYDTNYNQIEGIIAYDVNADGCNGTDDLVFPFIRVDINDGATTTAVYTNNLGEYVSLTPAGNYTITPNLENPTFFNVTPGNAMVNFSNTNNNTFNQDFCITNNGVNPDVEVVITPIGAARPGFDSRYMVTYINKGNQTVSGVVDFMYDDAVLDYMTSTLMPTTQSTGILSWNYTDLLPFESRSFNIILNVNSPMETPPVNNGDQLSYSAMITPIAGDIFPDDNQFGYTQTVVGSYDPNDITCIEGNTVNPNQIGEYLHYVINFENTGTFFAENIVVEMDIDPAQFDVNTLRLLNSSHAARVTVDNNTARFIFQNIFLPVDGQGNILLKIKSLNTLVENDIVSNQARIFFDFNFPIITNNAETTFAILSNQEFALDTSIVLYPNPTKDNIFIEGNSTIKTIELYDMQGRMLTQERYNSKNINLNISNQASGIYFIKIKTEKGVKTEKVVKM